MGKCTELPGPLWSHLHSTSTCSPTQMLSKKCPLGVFAETSLHMEDWLNYWSLAIQTPTLSWEVRGGIKSFNPSNHMVGSPGNQPPPLGAFQKSPHQPKRKHLCCFHHFGNSKSFRNSVPEMGMRTKLYHIINVFLIIYCITNYISYIL